MRVRLPWVRFKLLGLVVAVRLPWVRVAVRLPRVRFTLRGLMVAVIVVGLALGSLATLQRRAVDFTARYRQHAGELDRLRRRFPPGRIVPPPYAVRAVDYQTQMGRKYQFAASHPWFPVAPDPPPPD